MTDRPELLAPAGDWDCLRAAVANGADAVYFGLPQFNARLRAHNFTADDLPEVMRFLHRHNVRGFVALNTLIFIDELPAAVDQLRLLARHGVDAIIVQDLGLADLARRLTPGLAVHASTQMTITSPEGACFAGRLGAERVVLARELSLRELEKFKDSGSPPLEVFVHGALCVAYSGQCLTSESLGQRSANRGECAQACRMPYQLIVDGAVRDLGDRRYLLSPQDLAAVEQIPELIRLGVASFKIEGRLKSPEYVAAVTQVYRKAIDAALADHVYHLDKSDRYQLEMTFSRGLYPGWMHGVNHQELVSARFGKKRGAFVGRIAKVGRDWVAVQPETPLKPGDGLVFDTGGDTDREQGGRIYQIMKDRLYFRHDHIDFRKLSPGDRVWKTDDPALNERLRHSYTGRPPRPRHLRSLHFVVSGKIGGPMVLRAFEEGGASVEASSSLPLQFARTAPLTRAGLTESLGKLGDTPFELSSLVIELEDPVILPLRELNALRRAVIEQLETPAPAVGRNETLRNILDQIADKESAGEEQEKDISVLCRSFEQLQAALECRVQLVYIDFEDIRRGKDAVATVRAAGGNTQVYLATPRIQKAGEQGLFKHLEMARPDGILVRNLGAIDYFRERDLPMIGDFSLNVANPVSAALLMSEGLQRLTVSYDLNIDQVMALLQAAPARWFELTLHQHMPMFHMEHCVFAAFMSDGTDYTNCGRPCEKHQVHMRDRVGQHHPLRADVGCRNTLFNATPQSGADYYQRLLHAGLRHFRLELLEESADQTRDLIAAYRALPTSHDLWRNLHVRSQLGVTRGTLAVAQP